MKIPYKIVGRREGDVDSMYADVSLAAKCLGWKSKRSLIQMCKLFIFIFTKISLPLLICFTKNIYKVCKLVAEDYTFY